MGILTDRQIRAENIVEPCEPCRTRLGRVSYGLTSYGYDARIGYNFRVFKPYPCTVIDPKAFDQRMFEVVDLTPCKKCGDTGIGARGRNCSCPTVAKPDYILIPPHSFVLGETMETFKIPRDVLAVVVGKSTYARCGLIVNVTPLEPEWCGVVTVELSNTTPLPIKVYPGEGVMQVLFLRSDGHRAFDVSPFAADSPLRTCIVSYADKKGRYQDQTGVTPPSVHAATSCRKCHGADPKCPQCRVACPLCDGKGTNRAGQACIQCDAHGTIDR